MNNTNTRFLTRNKLDSKTTTIFYWGSLADCLLLDMKSQFLSHALLHMRSAILVTLLIVIPIDAIVFYVIHTGSKSARAQETSEMTNEHHDHVHKKSNQMCMFLLLTDLQSVTTTSIINNKRKRAEEKKKKSEG